jgi:outer membrane protein assembly factor BamB
MFRQLTNQRNENKIVRTLQVRCFRLETQSRLERGGNMSDPRERCQPITLFAFLFFACSLLCGIANAAPSITLSKKSGPPTGGILVSGRGFEPNVGVDIYFDTKGQALVVTNGKGEFDNAKAYAPRSARPGDHWVTALERNNDKGAQKPFLVQTDWSEFHFDADGTRLNPYENVLDRRTVRNLGIRWKKYLTGTYDDSSPAVVNGIVYTGSDSDYVYAFNARSGALLWRHKAISYVLSSPAVANGLVYLGSTDTKVGAGDGKMFALDANTGSERWSYTVGDVGDSSPTVVNGVVYIAAASNHNGKIYALNARTGGLLWSFATGSLGAYTPTVANGVVYIGSDNYNVYALNADTGALLWSFPVEVFTSPAVADGVVYVAAWFDKLYALDASTGSLLWSYPLNIAYSSPAVANGVVYVGNSQYVDALNAKTGDLLWRFQAGYAVDSSPAIANGVVYVAATDGNAYALDALTGSELWSYALGNGAYSSFAVVNGWAYIGWLDGNVYAFGLTGEASVNAEKQVAASKRPHPNTLRANSSRQVSQPGATP